MTEATLYMVGGAVRDMIMGNPNPKDIDFSVEAKSFNHMRQWLIEKGFEIFAESPKYFTIRARAPRSGFTFAGKKYEGITFDFALCRTDGEYKDGRHPESVEVGTIHTDLSRRDFTMNAIAMDASGDFLDPFNGREHIEELGGWIRCVGSTERLQEDGLRIMRALRFSVQLGFTLESAIHCFLVSDEALDALRKIDPDRIRAEILKMTKIDSFATMELLTQYSAIGKYIFSETGLWLEPTSAKK